MRLIITESQYETIISEDRYSALAHFSDRYSRRMSQKYLVLPLRERDGLDREIKKIFLRTFPKGNTAFRVFVFKPNPDSPNYIEQKGKPYYRFKDADDNIFIGDEAWVIIKNQNPITILVRRSVETRSSSAKSMFGVDQVLYGERDLERAMSSTKSNVGVEHL